MSYTIPMPVADDELDAIIITAVEGGINYWARCRAYSWEPGPVSVEVTEQEDEAEPAKPGWHTVNRAVIAHGLQVCSQKYPHVFATWARDRVGDAGSADVILQCGIFGEAIYG